jgi:hypothetical protein
MRELFVRTVIGKFTLVNISVEQVIGANSPACGGSVAHFQRSAEILIQPSSRGPAKIQVRRFANVHSKLANQPKATAMSRLQKFAKFLLIVVLPFFAVGCADLMKSGDAAKKEIISFHQLFNEERLGEIYSKGHEKLKSAASETEFLEFVTAVRKRLGRVTSTSNVGSNIQGVNLQTFVVLKQETKFEQGSGVETFTFIVENEVALLAGYYINSKDLLVK